MCRTLACTVRWKTGRLDVQGGFEATYIALLKTYFVIFHARSWSSLVSLPINSFNFLRNRDQHLEVPQGNGNPIVKGKTMTKLPNKSFIHQFFFTKQCCWPYLRCTIAIFDLMVSVKIFIDNSDRIVKLRS